jgi:hypothetical protein
VRTRLKPTRFWHLADLHLGEAHVPRCDTLKGGEDEGACAFCIRATLVDRLAHELRRARPDLVLFAGDIFENTAGYDVLAPFEEAARVAGTVLVGVRGQHDPGGPSLKRRFPWLLPTGGINDETGIFIRAVAGVRGESGWPDACGKYEPDPGGRPSVLLAHANVARFPGGERKTPRYRYYALGDRHRLHLEPAAEGAWIGNPGHLHSYWDGSGKAWPVFFIRGTIGADGSVAAQPCALEAAPFLAPPTRQLYTPFEHRDHRRGSLVLVHAPDDRVLVRARVVPSHRDEVVPVRYQRLGHRGYGAPARRAVFQYQTSAQREEIVRSILRAMPRDVFVSPSPGRGRSVDRIVNYGSILAREDQLPRFLEQTFMISAKTQTSDYEAGSARWT